MYQYFRNYSSSDIIYEYTIESLTIMEINKDDILNALGGLQRYRKLTTLFCND